MAGGPHGSAVRSNGAAIERLFSDAFCKTRFSSNADLHESRVYALPFHRCQYFGRGCTQSRGAGPRARAVAVRLGSIAGRSPHRSRTQPGPARAAAWGRVRPTWYRRSVACGGHVRPTRYRRSGIRERRVGRRAAELRRRFHAADGLCHDQQRSRHNWQPGSHHPHRRDWMAHRSGAGIRDVSAPRRGRVGRDVRPGPRTSLPNRASPGPRTTPPCKPRSSPCVFHGRPRASPAVHRRRDERQGLPTRPDPDASGAFVSGDRRGAPGVGRTHDSSGTIRLPDSISLTRDQRVLGTIAGTPAKRRARD